MAEKRDVEIGPPKRPLYDRDRPMDCRLALDEAFAALTDAAEAAGWNPDETAYALLHLAGANLKKRAANSAFDTAIARENRAAKLSIKTPAAAVPLRRFE